MHTKDLQKLIYNKALFIIYEFDGNVLIVVWKYPVVSPSGTISKWVDKQSLVISLHEDHDARVEGEVVRIINDIKWKD